MGDHEVCITRWKEEEEEEGWREGGRTASEVRDWHPHNAVSGRSGVIRDASVLF